MIRNRERSYLTDRAIKPQLGARENRQPPGRAQKQPLAAAGFFVRPVFFDLQIYEISENSSEEEWLCTYNLRAGQQCVMVITGGLNGTTLERNFCPQGIIIEETIELRVLFPPAIQETRAKAVEECMLSYQDAKGHQERIEITVPIHMPSGPIAFYLEYREPGKPFYRLGQRVINVQGSYNPEDAQLLEKCHIRTGLPAGTALLWVDTPQQFSTEQGYRLKMRGWGDQGDQLEETTTLDALVGVAQLFERDKKDKLLTDPEDIINILRRFSRRFSPRLLTWLLKLSRNAPKSEQFCLIIVDNTSLEIPWEMLDFGIDEQGHLQYLGATAQIVRWLPFSRAGGKLRWLEVKKVQHTGRIISYLDPDLDNAKVQKERLTLKKLCSQFYETLETLELRLRKRLDQVGLIYVGCHGLSGNRLFTNIQKPSDGLKAIKLEMLYPAPDARLTVFLNACESARIISGYQTSNSSFVEGFLTYCADGFIGTLASVDVQTASEIAAFVLERATLGEDIRVTETLRCLRQRAIQLLEKVWDLPKNQKKTELYQVLDTFMYVYYGNPLAYLHLQTADPESRKQEGA